MLYRFLLVKFSLVLTMLLLLSAFMSSAIAKAALNFSRNPLQLYSPDRAYLIQNEVHSSNKNSKLLYVEKPDQLFLRKSSDSNRKTICEYHRNVDVFWAPDSNSFILNNWKTSSSGDAYLFRLDALKKPVSLRDLLRSSGIATEDKELISNKDHSYVFADQWQGTGSLLVKASGHCSEQSKPVLSYTLYYLWDVKANNWKLMRRDLSENLERKVPNLSHFGA